MANDRLARALMAFGEGMTGRPFYSSYVSSKEIDPMQLMLMKSLGLNSDGTPIVTDGEGQPSNNVAPTRTVGGVSESPEEFSNYISGRSPTGINMGFNIPKTQYSEEEGTIFGKILGQTPESKIAQELAKSIEQKRIDLSYAKEKSKQDINIKKQAFSEDLENFLLVDDILQEARGTGLGRFDAGVGMVWEGIKQNSPVGRAVATHDPARKRLRVQLVRAAGDVGNINIVEQKAAEQMIPTQWDDYGVAALKRAYLKDMGRAIGDKSETNVKRIIKEFTKDMQRIGQDINNEDLNDLESIDKELADINKQLEAFNE